MKCKLNERWKTDGLEIWNASYLFQSPLLDLPYRKPSRRAPLPHPSPMSDNVRSNLNAADLLDRKKRADEAFAAWTLKKSRYDKGKNHAHPTRTIPQHRTKTKLVAMDKTSKHQQITINKINTHSTIPPKLFAMLLPFRFKQPTSLQKRNFLVLAFPILF